MMRNSIEQHRDPAYYEGVIDAILTIKELIDMNVPPLSALATVSEEAKEYSAGFIENMAVEYKED